MSSSDKEYDKSKTVSALETTVNSNDEERLSDKYRVFLCYRGETSGNSEGKKFAEKLHDFLTHTAFAKDSLGEIYLSEREDRSGNFKSSLSIIMKSVEYFIIPFTPNFFDGFPQDSSDEQTIDKSITYHELLQAFNNPNLSFINVCIGESRNDLIDKDLLVSLYGSENAERITTVKMLNYTPENSQEIFEQIYNRIRIGNESIADKIHEHKPNVYLDAKEELESDQFPLYSRLYNVRSLTLLNFASSSFISGASIAKSYEQTDQMKIWFNRHLIEGKITVNIILTDPHSHAAMDAALYKMNPENLTINKDQIILSNLNKLFAFMRKHPEADLHVYLTPVALPYGIMLAEFNSADKYNNYMKIDLYAADIERDGKRPSFFLLQKDEETKEMFKFFKDNVLRLKTSDSRPFYGHPEIDWMETQNSKIVHRGIAKEHLKPHTLQAFRHCINKEHPVEVDLFTLSDGTIVVGRLDEDFAQEICKDPNKLKNTSLGDLRIYNRTRPEETVLTLDEFLKLISGRIPILIEIKTINNSLSNAGKAPEVPYSHGAEREGELSAACKAQVSKIIETIHQYSVNYQHIFTINTGRTGSPIAIHSSDVRIVNMVNERDCLIPSGIIVSEFEEKYGFNASDQRIDCHQLERIEELQPDFVSYDLDFLHEGNVEKIKTMLHIPVISWTAKSKDQILQSFDYGCTNTICENLEEMEN